MELILIIIGCVLVAAIIAMIVQRIRSGPFAETDETATRPGDDDHASPHGDGNHG
ncbi:hypothetical protein [Yoonia sp.]|jgi:hypothetical protein|uniref:hypothetical protein n=1 Tax=Yoonia sp. TaxID=2212373 RepID=UPI0025F4E2B6|nr:hypothetical protein [Yoonia sp.]